MLGKRSPDLSENYRLYAESLKKQNDELLEELYKTNSELIRFISLVPRKEYLKSLSVEELLQICQSLRILVDREDDKADIIKAILVTENRIKMV